MADSEGDIGARGVRDHVVKRLHKNFKIIIFFEVYIDTILKIKQIPIIL